MYDDSTPANFTLIDGQTSTSHKNLNQENNSSPASQGSELYIQIKDEVVDQIIEHGLSKTESKLLFYFLKLDRFGDRPVKIKVAEILLATGVSKTRYHATIAKFETMGWFGFKHSDVEVTNFCVPTKLSQKRDSQSQKRDSQSQKRDSQSQKRDSKKPKVLPAKHSETPQTIQTYTDLLQTLSEGQREGFKKFCLKKIEECSFKIGTREAWLNKYGAEYLEEFKEMYSEAMTNERMPSKAESLHNKPNVDVDEEIAWLKRMYPDKWEEAAIYRGFIIPNSPIVEN